MAKLKDAGQSAPENVGAEVSTSEAAPATKKAPAKKYTVLSNLQHHGRMYRKGAQITMEDRHAAGPLQHKAIELAK